MQDNNISTAKKIFLTVLVAVFLISTALLIYDTIPKSENPNIVDLKPDNPVSAMVYISGAINKPGVYEVNQSTRVIDVVEMAGNFSEDADFGHIDANMNLSQIVKNEDHIYVPRYGERVLGSETVSDDADLPDKVNINTATLEELDMLDGIGPSTAQKIIDSRPFASTDDIKNVSGIGDATFEKIKDDITI